jgi:glycosyltransferase involved in cell wall biosynthesis
VGRARPIKIVAVAPPPHTGMTHVTAAMTNAFKAHFEVAAYTISYQAGEGRLFWALRKHFGLLSRMISAVRDAPSDAPTYLVLDSGLGAWGSCLLALIGLVRGTPLVVHHHVFSYFNRPSLAAKAFFQIAGPHTLHIVLCNCMARKLCSVFGADRRTVVLSNATFIEPGLSLRPRRALRRLGFIGNITRAKGIGLFMETVRTLSASGHDIAADIAGPVGDARLAVEIREFVAEDPGRRRTLGPVYGDEKQAFFNEIDVLLFPSQYSNEAQPVTIFEALAVGVPVLATPRGCISEQLPEEWVFDEASFASQASHTMEGWITECDDLAIAALRAFQLWQDALSVSQAELVEVFQAVSMSDCR